MVQQKDQTGRQKCRKDEEIQKSHTQKQKPQNKRQNACNKKTKLSAKNTKKKNEEMLYLARWKQKVRKGERRFLKTNKRAQMAHSKAKNPKNRKTKAFKKGRTCGITTTTRKKRQIVTRTEMNQIDLKLKNRDDLKQLLQSKVKTLTMNCKILIYFSIQYKIIIYNWL